MSWQRRRGYARRTGAGRRRAPRRSVRSVTIGRGPGASSAPSTPPAGPHQPVVFVDGTRRIDARLYISNGEPQAIPGLAASIGVGAVVCDGRARIAETRIDRFLTVGSGTRAGLA